MINFKNYIGEIEDFPKKGISFKDVSPVMMCPEAMKEVIDIFAENCDDVDMILAPDARGFLFGTPLAMRANKPFAMVRKAGKLPGEVIAQDYTLEYGSATLEIQKGVIKPGMKIAVVDDLLATGGTVKAIIDLVEKLGGEVVKALFVVELNDLKGRELLKPAKVISLVEY